MEEKIIRLKEIDSTNRFLRELKDEQEDEMVVAVADFQTAGKGQGSHTWESEAGKNLLFSIKVHPRWVPVRQQFLLSMAGAIAIKEALETYVDGITLKWPNDVYWNDKKISGTLIETSIDSRVSRLASLASASMSTRRHSIVMRPILCHFAKS